MAEKVTIMVLKVDLQCWRCYKKVKKVLAKFPQIRDQIYDEKANTVTIVVVCCSPEKIRDKICCKGGGSIKSIEIKPPPTPKLPEKPKAPEKPKTPEKPKESEKPKAPTKPKEPQKPEKPKDPLPKPPAPTPVPIPAPTPTPAPAPTLPPRLPEPCPPPPMTYQPIGSCCMECSHGIGGGPCYYGGPPPRPYYETYGRPVYDSWGCGGGPCYMSRSTGQCFSDDNPNGCSIM